MTQKRPDDGLASPAVSFNRVYAHYDMEYKIQWKPLWLATHLYVQNDWARWQLGVRFDIVAPAPLLDSKEMDRTWMHG